MSAGASGANQSTTCSRVYTDPRGRLFHEVANASAVR
jgi:hypothetical protein